MVDVGRIEAVVIGGSAGAFNALRVLLPALPGGLALPVMVVIHLPPDRPSAIADIFRRTGAVGVKEADDKEALAPGTVYFAPPGYHLLVEADRSLALSADEAVHHSRPSIDVLFESAADAFGDRLLGVVLSGANEDGAAGLKAVVDGGGQAIVQAPETAEHPVMPAAAVRATTPDAVLPVDAIAEIFSRLSRGPEHA
jgi:two-component system chemotaxis response regulator CheB